MNECKKQTPLNLKIIESYNFEKKIKRTDYDDMAYIFILPNGLALIGYFVLNSEPCETDSLESKSGEIYLTSKEQLDKVLEYLELLSNWYENN